MKKSIYHSLKTQQHPLLLRRPLPPKLPKVPLFKKKVRIVQTVKAREPKETFGKFDPDESALVKIDQNVSQSQRPTSSIQAICLDYENKALKGVVNIFPHQHHARRFHWKVPKSATGSMFIPRCLSASSRVFKTTLSQMKNRAKKSSKKEDKEEGYLDKKTFNTLVLSKEFSKPSPTSYSRYIASKSKSLGTKFHPATKISGYIQELPLRRDVKRTTFSPVSSVSSIIPEPQWSERPQPLAALSKVVLNTGSLPPPRSLPTPVLPRKPPRQAMIENAATAAAAATTTTAATTTAAATATIEASVATTTTIAAVSGKTQALKLPETVQRTARTIDPGAHILRGEGFKTVGATRSETILALTTLAIINCQIHGRNALNLKGFFLANCPDLKPLASQLIYLNLSFNDLTEFPIEIFCLQKLQVLKLRNNPIKEIPSEIHLLAYLRIFSIAFNYITKLPDGLFCLSYLEELDISYNEIENISNDIQKLRSLEKLIVDGNPISSFPPGILKLNLIKLRIENTFTASQFWLENSFNDPQQLTQICALFIVKNKVLDYIPLAVEKHFKSISECDWCHGPKFGEGFRIIRSCDMFGISHFPIMFHVCSSTCYRDLRESTFVLEGFPSRIIALHMDWVKENKANNEIPTNIYV